MELIVEKEWLTKNELRDWIGFSKAHIDRMECDPKYRHLEFPKRTRIGFKVYWRVTEIRAWMESFFANRA